MAMLYKDGGSEATIDSQKRQRSRHGSAFWVLIVTFGTLAFIVVPSAMMVTSTPESCAYCHEMKPAYKEWLTSTHRVNKKNIVVKCNDCHLPDSNNFVAFFLAKGYHGIKDLRSHFFGGEYDREKIKVHARTTIPDVRCQRCHEELLSACVSQKTAPGHRAGMYPGRGGYQKSCIKCHENMVHKSQQDYKKTATR